MLPRTHPSQSIFQALLGGTSWIGNQLKDQIIPQATLNGVIETHENYPDGLLAIPSTKGGQPRIVVPLIAQRSLVKQAHLDIHHQNHRKVRNLLYPLYWWPHMDRDIEKICQACMYSLPIRKNEEREKKLFRIWCSRSPIKSGKVGIKGKDKVGTRESAH